MADPIDPNSQPLPDISGVTDSLGKALDVVEKVTGSLGVLEEALKKTGSRKDFEQPTSTIKSFKKAITDATGSTGLLDAALGNVGNALKSKSPMGKIIESMAGVKTQFSKIAGEMTTTVDGLLKGMNKNVSGGGDVVNATLGGVLTRVKQLAATKVSSIILPSVGESIGKFEERMASSAKTSMQTSFAIGDGMARGASSVKRFNDTLANMQSEFVMTRGQAMEVAKVLSSGMGAEATSKTVFHLSSSYENLSKNMNAAEVAAAVATATGMDHTEVSKGMVTAYQELGASIEDSANMFGVINEASKNSGIGFNKTYDAIMKGAGALRMFGGTVDSVTPIYNAFAKSLDKGRQGLAPELFMGVINGIHSLGLETKAFLGLQSGVGGGSALQAGFEMEQAMSEGPEGMKKIMSSAMESMKQFGGGRITTLKEAATDPEAARNYAIQRDLLGKLLGVTGDKANKTMDMLSKMQDTGLKASDSAAKEMESIVKGASQVTSEATTTQERADTQLSAAIDKNAETIKGELNTLLKGTVFKSTFDGLNATIKSYIKTGQVDLKQLSDHASGAPGGKKVGREKQKEDVANDVISGKPSKIPKRMDGASFKPILESPEFLNMGDSLKDVAKNISGKINISSTNKNISGLIEEPKISGTVAPIKESIDNVKLDKGGFSVERAMKHYREMMQSNTKKPTTEAEEKPPIKESIDNVKLDKGGFSVERAMKHYREMRSQSKLKLEPSTDNASAAINQAQDAARTTSNIAKSDIVMATDTSKGVSREKDIGAEEKPVSARTARIEPEEIEVKIRVTVDNDSIKLNTDDRIIKIIKGAG